MLFNSLIFGVFLPVVFLTYWSLGVGRRRLQNLIVIVASYVFYGWWDVRFLSLIVLSSLIDFWVGRHLHSADDPSRRRQLLAISLSANLGTLLVFKYFNFFIGSARDALLSIGLNPPAFGFEIILPVGISFYTFQTLSYTIDIYRRRIEPVDEPDTFFAFVAFFPQLVAGPIERAERLLPQFNKNRQFDVTSASDGLRQMLWGLVKKVIIADNLAPYVELAFTPGNDLDGVALACGAFLFSVQLYCDFSGYSDMAIGMARLFGIRLSQNFAYPYFARTMREFWRRWHISLSTWFRDYLYIPLGGGRSSATKAARNVLIVFTVSGLWHGANWTFVVWGALNGLYTLPALLRNQPVASEVTAAGDLLPSLSELGAMFRTVSLWTFGLVFFRADSIGHAMDYLHQMVSVPWRAEVAHSDFFAAMGLGVLLLMTEWFNRDQPHALSIQRWPTPARWFVYIGLTLAIFVFGSVESREFVYFQF